MASDTAIALPDDDLRRDSAVPRERLGSAGIRRRNGRFRTFFSPLTLRILAVNVLALAILAGGVLYLDQYEKGLIESELGVLRAQSRLLAIAIGEGAVRVRTETDRRLVPEVASRLIARLAEPAGARIRLFSLDGALIADSRRLLGPGGVIEVERLPDISDETLGERLVNTAYNWVIDLLPAPGGFEEYREAPVQRAGQYHEVQGALTGETTSAVRRLDNGTLVISVATPVQHYKRVMGALMLTDKATQIDEAIRSVRLGILAVFGIALGVTVLLSIYLAGAIARPVRALAAAADRVRHGHSRQAQIPDLTARRDEIGDLSGALREMTEALWRRMDAIEQFAADVAHEIKNPLTSLRSAVETASRVRDPAQQQRLMAIILDDVHRLDRLISDISNASRLDSELSRAETGTVDIGRMIEALAEFHAMADMPAPDSEGPRVRITVEKSGTSPLLVAGMEDRLVQVFRNLLANALSFSHLGSEVRLRASATDGLITVTIEDSGPGIPEGKEEAIFERFYSERPEGEKFGTHSGLGLSISRQIVEAHGGRLTAENRRGPGNEILGARFVVTLPAS